MMGRLILLGVVVIVAVIVWLFKQAAGAVTGSSDLQRETMGSQTQKTMDTTARGINWLNEQWESAKSEASEAAKYKELRFAVATLESYRKQGDEAADIIIRLYHQHKEFDRTRVLKERAESDDGSLAIIVSVIRLSVENERASMVRRVEESLAQVAEECKKRGITCQLARVDENDDEIRVLFEYDRYE